MTKYATVRFSIFGVPLPIPRSQIIRYLVFRSSVAIVRLGRFLDPPVVFIIFVFPVWHDSRRDSSISRFSCANFGSEFTRF